MPKITFVKEKQEVEVPAGTNLRKAAMQAATGVTGVRRVTDRMIVKPVVKH